MRTRALSLVLLSGCYLPDGEAAPPQPRTSVAAHAGAGAMACSSSDNCAFAVSTTRTDPSRKTSVRVAKPAPATLGVEITLPSSIVDCSDALLTVVGTRRAVVGESVVLEAHATGAGLQPDTPEEETPAVLWTSPTQELTVLGPATVSVKCIELGAQAVTVKLAPPAPCPATLDFEIECFEAAQE